MLTMKRILIQPFIHAKKRYLMTLDSNDIQLYLKCYEGSSEYNAEVELTDPEFR